LYSNQGVVMTKKLLLMTISLLHALFYGQAVNATTPTNDTICSYQNNNIDLTDSESLPHKIQPVIKNNLFFNNNTESKLKHVGDALNIFWATKTSTQKYFSSDPALWIKKDLVVQNSTNLQLQWIGHASFLIQVNTFNILTDPLFYHLHRVLYPRKTPVGIDPIDVPKIDFIIISHNHRDHLDEQSMKMLKHHQPIMLVPQGTKNWFSSRGFENVIENNWWQKSTFRRNGQVIEFTFVPAVHWSGRSLLDAHTSLWGGWVIKANNQNLYFAGDTGFNEDIFKAIKEYAKPLDCALLPIGPCEPRKLMCHSHMGPEDAVQAYKILKPKLLIPMHWGTFGLGPDSFDAPIKRLSEAWQSNITAEKQDKLYKIKFGERISIKNQETTDADKVATVEELPIIEP
jgi:L-ascorbate metabolism protein UlaG (beta-lactamase superfamily)